MEADIEDLHIPYFNPTLTLGHFKNKSFFYVYLKYYLELIMEYGTDIGLIESFFPTRTRGQIKRKHRDVTMARKKMLERFENKIIRESRKSYFDEEILEEKMIKWISKPNKQGNSNSDETI